MTRTATHQPSGHCCKSCVGCSNAIGGLAPQRQEAVCSSSDYCHEGVAWRMRHRSCHSGHNNVAAIATDDGRRQSGEVNYK